MTQQSRGQIEIVVLGVVFLMSIFVFSMAHRAGIEYRISRSRLLELQAYFFARAGVESVLSEIESDTTKVDAFSDGWGNHSESYQRVRIGDGFFEVINSSDSSMFGAGDEEFKININHADKSVLMVLFSAVTDDGKAETLADAILEYRKEREGRTAFGLVEELLSVEGMSEDLYVAVKEDITVYGKGKININTVNDRIMKVLGLTDGLIGKLNDYRKGVDGIYGTEDDHVFDNVDSINSKLGSYVHLTPQEMAKINALKNRWSVRSDNFSWTSYGWINEDVKKSIKVVVAREKAVDEKKELKIRYWYEE